MPKKSNEVRWTKRKLFTVKFKNREPRALLWRKKVYSEWFHYAKLAQSKGLKIPREFGDLSAFSSFESWWRDERYGFELFCEQPMGELIREPTTRDKPDPNEVLIRVNLKGDMDLIKQAFDRFLKVKDVAQEYESNARFQPSKPMKNIAVGVSERRYEDVKRDNKLAEYRKTYLLVKKLPFKDVAVKLGWLKGDKNYYLNQHENDDGSIGLSKPEYQKLVDNRVKKVKRHVDQVEAIFESIAGGTFP